MCSSFEAVYAAKYCPVNICLVIHSNRTFPLAAAEIFPRALSKGCRAGSTMVFYLVCLFIFLFLTFAHCSSFLEFPSSPSWVFADCKLARTRIARTCPSGTFSLPLLPRNYFLESENILFPACFFAEFPSFTWQLCFHFSGAREGC